MCLTLNCGSQGGTTYPVQWTEGSVQYTGAFRHLGMTNTRAAWNQIINYYFTVECQTLKKSDCGIMGLPPSERPSTHLREWFNWMFVPFTLPDIIPAPEQCPSEAIDTIVGTVLNGRGPYRTYYIREFNVQVMGSCEKRWRSYRSDDNGVTKTNMHGANFASTKSGALDTINNNAQAFILEGVDVGQRVALHHWASGEYRDTSAAERPLQAHTNTYSDMRFAIAEVLAEFDRVYGKQELPTGMSWNPVPTEQQLLAVEPPGPDPDDPDPTDPGGGNGGTVDPGNCDEGWFLTKLVCEIRTQGERLWTFVSHDAWVPETDWSTRFEGIQTEFQGKLNIFNLRYSDFGLPDWQQFGTIDPNTHKWCSVELNIGLDRVGPYMPSGGFGQQTISTQINDHNLCRNPLADFWHTTGRPLLAYFLAMTFVVYMYKNMTARV